MVYGTSSVSYLTGVSAASAALPSAAVSVTSDVVISCAAVSSYGTSFTRSDHT